jgi:hypothetical protein
MSLLPVARACELAPLPEERRWLVEGLWSEQAVGILGGEPKSFKSFLALELAVAIASGMPALRRFPVQHPGPVLLFAAEDALHVVRERLLGIAAAAGVALAALDVHVITAPALRLDLRDDAARLLATVAALKPRLLVLDPFVRLHRVDENAAAEVAPLLASLRELQRRHGCAVLLVHHARKGSAGSRPGQALRGSSELHAWGDSNLYVRRRGDGLVLSVEHRAAPSPADISLRLRSDGDALALAVESPRHDADMLPPPALHDRIRAALAAAPDAVPLDDLRAACRVRKAALCSALADLARDRVVARTDRGYVLASASA